MNRLGERGIDLSSGGLTTREVGRRPPPAGPALAAAPIGQRRALLIGINRYDDPSAAPLGDLADDPIFEGQFKTPALRGIADTAPYGHGGTYADLPAVLNVLASGGDSGTTSPARDPALIRFDAASPKNDNLLLFLRTLTGDVTTP